MSATRLIEGALDKIRAAAGVKTVYGEPIKVNGKTIIPIAKVAFGAGVGTKPEAGVGASPATPEAAGTETESEGAGAGAYAAPVGVVEISDTGTKFVAIGMKKKLTIAAFVGAVAGMVLGLFAGRGKRPPPPGR